MLEEAMTAKPRRFTKTNPCPICGGHDTLGRGQGIRCFGYYDSSGKYARCTREERAGGLPCNSDGTYSHRLGPCRCGLRHGEATAAAGEARTVAPAVRQRAEQRFRSYFTLAAYLRKRHGGREAFRILRVDYAAPDGSMAKSYRPCHQGADGRWHLSRPALPLPLYHLPSILAAPPEAIVAILEGEKCANLALSLGLGFVTTSAHGAAAPQLTDWSPLAGRTIAVIPDQGGSGADYAAKVAGLLAALEPPASVYTVSLPGLADGEDIEQWIGHRRQGGNTDAEILAELQSLIAPPR
jgi:hypothetical protein